LRSPLREKKLLQNGVFQHLSGAEADDGLGLNLDLFAGLGVAAHARLAMSLHDATNSRNDKFARAALGFLHSELVELVEELSGGLFGRADLFGDVRNDLCLAEWLSCHFVCLSS
jgi:hypothetical protein